jgi:hypothetical protein
MSDPSPRDPTHSDTLESVQERLAQLEQLVLRLQGELAASRASGPDGALPLPVVALPHSEVVQLEDDGAAMTTAESTLRGKRARASRRALLKLGGAMAAAGAVAASSSVVGNSSVAQARPETASLTESASGLGNVAIQVTGSSGAHGIDITTDTGYGVNATATGANANAIFATSTNGYGVGGTTANDGYSGVTGQNTANGIGVFGLANGTGLFAAGVYAKSPNGYGMRVLGGTAQILFALPASPGAPTAGSHIMGELYVDSAATLWVCIADGAPGTWVRLTSIANGTLGGTIHYLSTPLRLLDARTSPGTALVTRGPLAANETYAFTVAGLGGSGIPAGAQGLIANMTVLGPSGAGNLSLFPAPGPGPSVASMTFGTPGLFLANGVNVGIGTAGQIMIQNQSSGTTPLVLDAVAYVS